MEIDKSLEKKQGEKRFAEIEGQNSELVNLVDSGLRNAANINNIVPELVKPLIHSEIAAAISPLHTDFQNLIAHVQAGTTNQYQMNQLLGLLSQTLNTVHELQDEIKKLKEKKSWT
jgi:microcompartment protein CcmL/EutN